MYCLQYWCFDNFDWLLCFVSLLIMTVLYALLGDSMIRMGGTLLQLLLVGWLGCWNTGGVERVESQPVETKNYWLLCQLFIIMMHIIVMILRWQLWLLPLTYWQWLRMVLLLEGGWLGWRMERPASQTANNTQHTTNRVMNNMIVLINYLKQFYLY